MVKIYNSVLTTILANFDWVEQEDLQVFVNSVESTLAGLMKNDVPIVAASGNSRVNFSLLSFPPECTSY